jgi:hypothetical protein
MKEIKIKLFFSFVFFVEEKKEKSYLFAEKVKTI